MERLAGAFARRWPNGTTRLLVETRPAAAMIPEGSVVEIAAGVPVDRWFEIVDAALGAGAWVALPAGAFEDLGAARGVAGPLGAVLLLAPAQARANGAARLVDIAVSLALLAALSPLFLLIAAGVLLSGAGPVLYRARVIGRGGARFTWYKFRTMRPGGELDEAARRDTFAAFARGERREVVDAKIVDASRVTRFGAWLRRHSLDELPQLWNVLAGQMALVGPRPCLPYEEGFYDAWRRRRFEVRPGLTGLWQVYGRSRVDFEAAALMDALYGYVSSLRLDLGLVARTVVVMFRGLGGR